MRAGTFDEFQHGNARKGLQHGGKLRGAALIGDAHQCGAAFVENAERAEGGDSTLFHLRQLR